MEELLKYYADLLIIQYADKEKARATIQAFVNAVLAEAVFNDVRDGYNIETAIGVQLDVIGKYAGIDRFYGGVDFDNFIFFGFSDEFLNEPAGVTGFADETDFLTKDGTFLSLDEFISGDNKLNDDDFRFLIKLKIFVNNSKGSHESIDNGLNDFFGNDVIMVEENHPKTISYFLAENIKKLFNIALNKKAIPKPLGVGIRYIYDDLIYFGFADINGVVDPKVTGFADETDFLTKNGTFITLENITEVA